MPLIAAGAAQVGGGILQAFGAAREQSQRQRLSAAAERQRQEDIRQARAFAREETLSPEQRQLRTDLSVQLGDILQGRRAPAGFGFGRDIISRTSETQRQNLRGESGVPAGLFTRGLSEISRGEQSAFASFSAQEQQNVITQILQLLGLGTPRFGFQQPSAPITPTVGPSAETVLGGTLAQGGRSFITAQGAAQSGGAGGGSIFGS